MMNAHHGVLTHPLGVSTTQRDEQTRSGLATTPEKTDNQASLGPTPPLVTSTDRKLHATWLPLVCTQLLGLGSLTQTCLAAPVPSLDLHPHPKTRRPPGIYARDISRDELLVGTRQGAPPSHGLSSVQGVRGSGRLLSVGRTERTSQTNSRP